MNEIQRRLVRYYRRSFWKWMKKNRIFKMKNNRKIKSIQQKGKRPSSILVKQVPIMQEYEFCNAMSSISQKLHSTPIKILLSSSLQFNYPQKVIIRVSKNQKNQSLDEIDYNDKDAIFLEVKAEEFLQEKTSQPQQNKTYSISVPQMTLSKEDFTEPQFVKNYFSFKNNNLYAANLWHYKKPTLTKWHYDAHDNFLFQIQGAKQIQLIEPNTPNKISRSINQKIQPNNNKKQSSYVCCESVFGIDNNHVQQFQKLNDSQKKQNDKSITVTIRQNECLFIPRGWFHKVKSQINSQGNNMAVNFWGNTIQTYNLPNEQLQINLKQLIFQLSENLCQQNVQRWDEMGEDMKKNFRNAYFLQYMKILSPQ